MKNRLLREVSKLTKPGPRKLLRLPISPGNGLLSAALAAVGSAKSWMRPEESVWMLVDSADAFPVKTPGLSKINPIGNAPVFVLNAKPEWAVKMLPSCQPPIIWFAQPGRLLPSDFPRPNGKSYTPFAENKCVTSKSEFPRHTRRFAASQTSPPTTVLAILETLSIECERV